MKRKLFGVVGALVVLLTLSLALAGCDVLNQAALGCSKGYCEYDPKEKVTTSCGKTSCSIYQAAQKGSTSFEFCSCGKKK
jgi:hypothetical protein